MLATHNTSYYYKGFAWVLWSDTSDRSCKQRSVMYIRRDYLRNSVTSTKWVKWGPCILFKAVVRMFCLFVAISIWKLYFAITDSSLRLVIYDPNYNFHRILPSEQASIKFVLPNWGKKNDNKSRYQWWLNLTIGSLISHQTEKIIIIVILYSQIINVNKISIAWLWVQCVLACIYIFVQSNLIVMPF